MAQQNDMAQQQENSAADRTSSENVADLRNIVDELSAGVSSLRGRPHYMATELFEQS